MFRTIARGDRYDPGAFTADIHADPRSDHLRRDPVRTGDGARAAEIGPHGHHDAGVHRLQRADQPDRLPVPDPRPDAGARAPPGLVGGDGRDDRRALHVRHARLLAAGLCRHRAAHALVQRLRADRAVVPEGRVPARARARGRRSGVRRGAAGRRGPVRRLGLARDEALPAGVMRRLVLALALLLAPVAARADAAPPGETPLDKAYDFLGRMMDLHAQGDDLRLAQSFVATPSFDNGDTSYTYDDAVAITALLARRTPAEKRRARILGDSLVAAQARDEAGDGRLRDAYHTAPFLNDDGTPRVASASSYTGNLHWEAMGLLQLW